MKRMLFLIGLLVLGGVGAAAAQSRVRVAVTLVDPHFAAHVVIGRPYHRYARPYYHRYRPHSVIVVAPRAYRPARVVVVRPHRYHPRRGRRGR